MVNNLKDKFGTEELSVKSEIIVKINFKKSILTTNGRTYSISPTDVAAQNLIIDGGLEEENLKLIIKKRPIMIWQNH